jgi:phosphoglycerate dehydrogenase-like enzyme
MEKLHVHFMHYKKEEPIYQATEAQIQDALARHPDLIDRVTYTIGDVEKYYPCDWSEEQTENYFAGAKDATVLYGYTFVTEDLLGYAPKLKWIQSASAGVEQLTPFDWIPDGVTLTNSRGVHQERSGESFAMYLAMLNAQLPRLMTAQFKGKWDRVFTSVIKGKTLVVIGVGHQGGEMARQGKNMGMTVIGLDPYVTAHPHCDEVLPMEKMKEAFAKADFMAICAPLTKETQGLVGAEQLSWLPPHAGVINVARGPLMEEKALSDALYAGKLSGAVLDVFDETPLPEDSFLWTTPNIFLSPHVSSDDPIRYSPLCLDILMRNIQNYFAGRPFENIVNTKSEF